MGFRIGAIYRYSSRSKEREQPEKQADGLPNFFYETYLAGASSICFQKGIHNIAGVTLPDGTKRIPAIIISSSPHKAGTDPTPWSDDFNPDYGSIRYYGDNKCYNPGQPTRFRDQGARHQERDVTVTAPFRNAGIEVLTQVSYH